MTDREQQMETTDIKQELSNLDRDISKAKLGAIAIMVLVMSTYFLWFAFKVNASVSYSSTDWGTLGDFFGGLLNPVIGLFALYWLTKSVRLQKEELFETRSELAKQVEMAALTALIHSIMAEVEILRNNSAFLCDQLAKHTSGHIWNLDGAELTINQAHEKIAEINHRMSGRLEERLHYEDAIKKVLNMQKNRH